MLLNLLLSACDVSYFSSVFVGNLSWNVTEESLKEFFEENELNPIATRVITNSDGRSKGYVP